MMCLGALKNWLVPANANLHYTRGQKYRKGDEKKLKQ